MDNYKSLRFEGKRYLLSGASSGIGKSCALRLAEEGAGVVLLGRNEASLAALGLAGRARLCGVDLTNEAAVKELLPRIKKEAGQLDGLVLAAGVHSFRPLLMESYADLAKPFGINVQGALGLLALAVKHRLLAQDSAVVLFSSAAAQKGSPGAVAYAASKGAIEAATRSLALELASQRIRVNAVAPGIVRTPMSGGMLAKLTAEQIATLESRHPWGFGTPEDVAGAVAFLLSSDARWITGAVLPVDGGFAVA
jgi:NAD(P)-dependent dehydrogenase (short-subunit alcohol dehydrogenase family)